MKLLDIIYESTDLLVVNKPAGLVCHPTKTDEFSSLISRARLHVGTGSKPQLVNRLDRETSGVTLIALNPDSARLWRQAWERRLVEKEYLAIAHGSVALDSGVIDAPLGDDEHSMVAIKGCVRPDGAPAQTAYRVQARFSRAPKPGAPGQPFTLLNVFPSTGRKHQIRIHLAHIGHPVVGDKLYGPDEDLYLALVENRLTQQQREQLILPYHALHASKVAMTLENQPFIFEAKPESWFAEFCAPQ